MTPVGVITEDQLAMATMFPQFVLRRPSGRTVPPFWTGIVQPLGSDGQAFELRATYQANHLSPLRLTVLRPALPPQTPHRYANGDLCTFYPPLGSWLRGRPGDDLVELLRFAVTWLVRYTCWQMFDGWWPGVEVPHDPRYLVGHLHDDDYCPYHSPSRWGECCKTVHVRAAQTQMQRQEMLAHGILEQARGSQAMPSMQPARKPPVALSSQAEQPALTRPTHPATSSNRRQRALRRAPGTTGARRRRRSRRRRR
jgi:hypothetical protein